MATTCSFWNFKRWLNECIGTKYELSDLAKKYQENPKSRQGASDSLNPENYKKFLASLRDGLCPRGISVLTDFFSPVTTEWNELEQGIRYTSFEGATSFEEWLKNILSLLNRDALVRIVSFWVAQWVKQQNTGSKAGDFLKSERQIKRHIKSARLDELRQVAERLIEENIRCTSFERATSFKERLIEILALLNRDALVRIVSFWLAQWVDQQDTGSKVGDFLKSERQIKRYIKSVGDADLRQVAAALISANDAEKKGKTNQEFIQEFIDKIKTTTDWFKKLEKECHKKDDSKEDSKYKKIKKIYDSEDKGKDIKKSASDLITLFQKDLGWWRKCDPNSLDRIRNAIDAYIDPQKFGSPDEFIKAVNTLDALKKVYTGKLKGNESYKSYLPGDSKVTSPDDSKVTSPDDPKANSSDDSQKELNPIREIFKKNTTTCGNAGKAIIEDHPAICEIFNKNIRGEIKKQAYRWRWVAAVVMLLVIMSAGLIGINYWFNREIKIATKGIAVERYKEGLIVTGYYEGVAQSEPLELIIPQNFSEEGRKIVAIAAGAFSGCKNLTSVVIPATVETIGEGAFEGCPITKATIPTSAIEAIPKGELQTVVLTSGKEIRAGAFSGCTNLTSVTIPNSVKTIGENAFKGCDSLTKACIDLEGWCTTKEGKKICWDESAIEASPKDHANKLREYTSKWQKNAD